MGTTRVMATVRNPAAPERCREGLFPVGTGAEPLPGVTALGAVGVEVDPVDRRLRRLPAVRLGGTGGVGAMTSAPPSGEPIC